MSLLKNILKRKTQIEEKLQVKMESEGCTADQRRCVEELRNRMTGLMPKHMYEDDSLFLRFLVARDYDLNAAEAMLKANLNWIKTNKIDTLLTDYTPPEVATKYIPADHLGYTKDGLPIVFCRFGNIDFKGLLKSLKKSEIVTFIAYRLEQDLERGRIKSLEKGKQTDKFFFIFDLSDFTLATATYKPTLDILVRLAAMFDGNYPERLKTAYIINASLYFTLLWTVFSPFLAKATFQKVKVFGKDGWQNALLNEVDADLLPAFLGGNLRDPDGNPMCRTLINHGGQVPTKYFSRRDNSFRKKSNAKKIFVHRMSKERVEIKVDEPGSILEWEFEVKSKDIGFSVLFKESNDINSIPKEIVPQQRIETVISTETGLHRCFKSGIYILEFDNTYSWMYSKELYYTAAILKSDQVVEDL